MEIKAFVVCQHHDYRVVAWDSDDGDGMQIGYERQGVDLLGAEYWETFEPDTRFIEQYFRNMALAAQAPNPPTRIDAHGQVVYAGPGERWFVDPRGAAGDDTDICVLDENRLVVATLQHATDEEGERSVLDTARLIAAAPALLDALVLAYKHLNEPATAKIHGEVLAAIGAILDSIEDPE